MAQSQPFQQPPSHSTSLLCQCCAPGRKEVLAKAHFDRQAIEVRDRRYGTSHVVSMGLAQIVMMLDPHSTSFIAVGSAAK